VSKSANGYTLVGLLTADDLAALNRLFDGAFVGKIRTQTFGDSGKLIAFISNDDARAALAKIAEGVSARYPDSERPKKKHKKRGSNAVLTALNMRTDLEWEFNEKGNGYTVTVFNEERDRLMASYEGFFSPFITQSPHANGRETTMNISFSDAARCVGEFAKKSFAAGIRGDARAASQAPAQL
jgi:hypothetical protein